MAKRNYPNDYVSVTQCLSGLRKPGLEQWFLSNTRAFCNTESSKGKLIGTLIHQGIEDFTEGREVKIETEHSNEVMNALKGFMGFRKEHPEIIFDSAEVALTSEKYQFNGTIDSKSKEKNLPVIVDYKTTKAKGKPIVCYPEYFAQVSAYCKLWEEVFKEKISTAYILILAKDEIKYHLQKVSKQEIDGHFENIFLPCLKICKFQKGK